MKSFTEIYPTLKRVGNYRIVPVECNDGFQMSIQASEFHYCTPRDNTGPYCKFEIGYPSEPEDLILKYAEDPAEPTGTVYGWVPVEVIDEVIAKHGGIKEV